MMSRVVDILLYITSRDRYVGMATGYGLVSRVSVRFPARERLFSFR
jgi:hypothetical protein